MWLAKAEKKTLSNSSQLMEYNPLLVSNHWHLYVTILAFIRNGIYKVTDKIFGLYYQGKTLVPAKCNMSLDWTVKVFVKLAIIMTTTTTPPPPFNILYVDCIWCGNCYGNALTPHKETFYKYRTTKHFNQSCMAVCSPLSLVLYYKTSYLKPS